MCMTWVRRRNPKKEERAVQKYAGQKIKILKSGNKCYIGLCPDGNIVAFSKSELREKKVVMVEAQVIHRYSYFEYIGEYKIWTKGEDKYTAIVDEKIAKKNGYKYKKL